MKTQPKTIVFFPRKWLDVYEHNPRAWMAKRFPGQPYEAHFEDYRFRFPLRPNYLSMYQLHLSDV